MYKTNNNRQLELTDFNQPIGLTMDPNNRWVRLAAMIPWKKYEHKYARLFIGSKVGNVAKPFRMALGSLIIQQKLGFSDRELVEEITENPYLQYFIGLPGYQQERPFDPSMMTLFRKRMRLDVTKVINEAVIQQYENPESENDDDHKDDHHSDGGSGTPDEPQNQKSAAGTQSAVAESEVQAESADNSGTLILDATCAPSNIRYPQDFSLLNEAREKLEKIIHRFHTDYGLELPRMYNRIARKKYLDLAKSKKRSAKKIRRVIRFMLNCIRRDDGYLEDFMAEGYAPCSSEIRQISTIRKLYEQQLEMYQNKTHRVDDRIVSIQQPYLRPIVRGKTKAPVEFGTKFDLSLDEHGMGRIEKIHSIRTTRAEPCRMHVNAIVNGRGTILRECWSTRSTATVRTGSTVKIMVSGCQGQSLGDRVPNPFPERNGKSNTVITRTGLKLSGHSASANAAIASA